MPFAAMSTSQALATTAPSGNFAAVPKESSVPNRLVSASDPVFDPMGTYGSGAHRRTDDRKPIVMYGVGGAAAIVVLIVIFIATRGHKDPAPQVAAGTPTPTTTATAAQPTGSVGPATGATPATPPAPPAVADQNTGFDLYVTTPGITQWRLDGDVRTDHLPSRIRGITPGVHNVSIDPPAGFMSQSEQVVVEAGKSSRVDIALPPIQGIVGTFESEPPGATVTLIIDGKRQLLGASPAKAPLDPRSTYQVLFERPGYVSVNKPIAFSGGMEEKIVVNLERAGNTISAAPVQTPVTQPQVAAVGPGPEATPPRPLPAPHPVTPTVAAVHAKLPTSPDVAVNSPDGDTPKAGGMGKISIGSKPPCKIFIDGSDLDASTPKANIPIAAGKHKVTLMNNEFGIKESFFIDVKPDQTEKVLKDYSDKIPQ
jgi:hypothetical protein